jgi:hypothetical protein
MNRLTHEPHKFRGNGGYSGKEGNQRRQSTDPTTAYDVKWTLIGNVINKVGDPGLPCRLYILFKGSNRGVRVK